MAILSVVMHAGAATAVLSSAIPGPVQACIALGLAGWCIVQVLGFHAERKRSPRDLILTVRGEWRLLGADGVAQELIPAPQVFVHPWLIVLHFGSGRGVRHVFALTPDNTDADVLRRLRVRLRFPMHRETGNGAAAMH